MRLEIEGSPKRGLVLAPLHGGLFCAAFLTSDIPELPQAPVEQPQQQKELRVGCTHAPGISFENAEYLQGDPCDNQTNAFVTGPLVRLTLPQQFVSQQPQACVQGPLPQPLVYMQGPLSQPQVQEGKPRASLDAQHALIGEFVSGNGELATTAVNNMSIDFYLADSS